MSAVLSVRIPSWLKAEMEELKDMVNWPQEIRRFLEERVRYYKRLKVLAEVCRTLEGLPSTPKGLAARLVREDRDSG